MRKFLLPILLIAGLTFGSSYEQKALQFITLLSSNDFENTQKMVSDVFLNALNQSSLTMESFWNTLNQQVGKLEQVKRIKLSQEQGYQVVYVACEFEKASLDARIVFDRDEKIAGLQFLPYIGEVSYQEPEYVDKNRFYEIECTVKNDKWELPAILTVPKGEGPFPAVVLVHGSGPNDKDETIGPNKPFKDIAWGLASKGIAVLRYDKRTKIYAKESSEMIGTFTVNDETVNDAVTAIDLLSSFDMVDKNKIFLIGHSLGGTVAPRIATMTDKLSGLILMAPAAHGFYAENLLSQLEYIFSLDGKIDETESKQLDETKQQLERIKSRQMEQSEVLIGASKKYWEDLLDYDPLKVARSLEIPILILQGARDYQVTIKDFEMWKEALSEKQNVSFKFYEKLNHLFMPGEGPSTPYEYQKPNNIPEEVIEDIVQWIKTIK